MIRLALLLSFTAALPAANLIQDSFSHLYNFDFNQAHQTIDAHIAAHPHDPLGPTARAAAFLFSELDRLNILAGEFFTDDKRISGNEKLTPDPRVRDGFFSAVEQAQRLAEEALRKDSADTRALFSFSLTEGMRTDYMALIEKKQLRSLSALRQAQRYGEELLRHDPNFADAYLTHGVSEYLLGSLPFFIRWFVRIDGASGDKKAAVAHLERVAAHGRYLGPFAKILLAVINVREKRPQESIRLLEELTAAYPRNPLLRNELEKLRKRLAPR
jgi:hypothetical protein